jgi:hypothetical protein
MAAQSGAARLKPAGDTSPFDVSKADSQPLSATMIPQLAAYRKRSLFSLIVEIARLWFGIGRLSLDEYLELKLFDDDAFKGVDKRSFVGLKAARKMWFKANYRVELFAMVTNKITSSIWFAAHGLPILPTIAIFHEQVGRHSARLLRDCEELRTFLKTSEHYPIFGKPISGWQSIGSASIEAYQDGFLITTAGRVISLDNFIAYVKAHAATGYQFQSRISPHSIVREMCGDRLATVRVLTIVKDRAPHVLRACWKIPAGPHIADNFWRPGNLLAQLDLASGRVERVIRRVGTSYEEVTHHPDTGQRIDGMFVPNWSDVIKLAIDAANLLDDLPLVGWDIAPTQSGAVLVEANITPDFQIHQLSDRRGLLDAVFKSFLKQRQCDAASAKRSFKRLTSSSRSAFLKRCWREVMSTIRSQPDRRDVPERRS